MPTHLAPATLFDRQAHFSPSSFGTELAETIASYVFIGAAILAMGAVGLVIVIDALP